MSLIYLDLFADEPLPLLAGKQDTSTVDSLLDLAETTDGGLFNALGNSRTPPVLGEITASATLVGVDETALRRLRALRGTRNRLWRRWKSSGVREWTWAWCKRITTGADANEWGQQPLAMTFQPTSPAWYSEAAAIVVLSDLVDSDDGDMLTLGVEGGDSYPVSFALVNAGDQPVVNPFFTFTASATVTNVTITNTTTGHSMSWTGSLPANQPLIIDAGVRRLSDGATGPYQRLTTSPTDARWFILREGVNQCTLSVTPAVEARLEIIYHHPYT